MAKRFIWIAIFLGIIGWFKSADVYHLSFFTSGAIVVYYNFFRLAFVLAITSILYATGYLTLCLFKKYDSLSRLSIIEKYLFCFSAGVGVWHIAMLLLGLVNLYYLAVIMFLCCAVLALASNHLNNVAYASVRDLRAFVRSPRLDFYSLLPPIIFLLFLSWMFIVAALYPAGGHDYFTHYFHYYNSVIKQHGLSPNDVWYHYYYSKGAGLHFMAIILTDPLSPALMTFVCVMSASLALYSFSIRLLPRSLWPLLCAVAYLSYYILPFGSGGQFQKTHEEVSALIVMIVWLLSLSYVYRDDMQRSIVFTLSLVLIGLVILTQAISIFLATYFSLILLFALISKNYESAKRLFFLAFLVSVVTILMLSLNYFATGLITDQEINLAWRYANVEKLKEWGVLPNVMLVAWIRDNYQGVALPWDIGSVWQSMLYYTRSSYLSFALICSFIPLIITLLLQANHKFRSKLVRLVAWVSAISLLLTPLYILKANKKLYTLDQIINFFLVSKVQLDFYIMLVAMTLIFLIIHIMITHVEDCHQNIYEKEMTKILLNLAAFIGVFAVLSAIFGHSQVTSFYRFSSFFFPLMLLACSMSWSYLNIVNSQLLKLAVPVMVAIGVVASWSDWVYKSSDITPARINYAIGRYSIAEAYQKQHSSFPFGGIHPGTWEAVQHVPHGERVWSTTVVSYCMAPDCYVESVISYKFSSRMSEILSGTPEAAKSILQSEGLNYFLFLSEYPLLDYLPYSQLFKPENISKFFTIKWTDNKTFLLTWKSPHDKPLSANFLKLYSARLAEKEDQSFRFSQSIKNLKIFMDRINEQKLSLHPVNFPWQDYISLSA